MAYAYFITLEVRTPRALGTGQQEKLREKLLEAIDLSPDTVPYGADVVTATIGGEEKV